MFILFILSLWNPVEVPTEPYQIHYNYSQTEHPGLLVADDVNMIDVSGQVMWIRNVGSPVSAFPLAKGAAMLLIERAPEAAKMELQFIDHSGQWISTHHIKSFLGPVRISKDMERVLVRSGAEASLFSSDGQILATYPGEFTYMAIEEAGSRIALASGKTVSIYSGQNQLASIELDNPFVRDMVFSPMGAGVAILTSSSVFVWQHDGDLLSFIFEPSDGSARVVSLDSDNEEVLVVFRTNDSFEFEIWNLDSRSSERFTQSLSSLDETVVEAEPYFQDWLIHLTSGWYSFNPGGEK